MLRQFFRDDFNRFHIGVIWERQYSKQGCTDTFMHGIYIQHDSNNNAVTVFGNNLQMEVLKMKIKDFVKVLNILDGEGELYVKNVGTELVSRTNGISVLVIHNEEDSFLTEATIRFKESRVPKRKE